MLLHRKGLRMGPWVALCAALVLMLQAFTSGFVAAAAPVAPMVDAFGNVLCMDSGHGGSVPSDEHGKMVNCCTFGCSTTSPLLVAREAQQAWLIELRSFAANPLGMTETIRAEHPDFDPGSPRAPPVTC